jgi:hypothetical protein
MAIFFKTNLYIDNGEPLWLSGKVVKNEKINEIERTRVCSPPRATSLKNLNIDNYLCKSK